MYLGGGGGGAEVIARKRVFFTVRAERVSYPRPHFYILCIYIYIYIYIYCSVGEVTYSAVSFTLVAREPVDSNSCGSRQKGVRKPGSLHGEGHQCE
jgi:hypothetical protein